MEGLADAAERQLRRRKAGGTHGLELPPKLLGTEGPGEPARPGGAERASHGTAHLRREAERVAAIEHGLDDATVSEMHAKAPVLGTSLDLLETRKGPSRSQGETMHDPSMTEVRSAAQPSPVDMPPSVL